MDKKYIFYKKIKLNKKTRNIYKKGKSNKLYIRYKNNMINLKKYKKIIKLKKIKKNAKKGGNGWGWMGPVKALLGDRGENVQRVLGNAALAIGRKGETTLSEGVQGIGKLGKEGLEVAKVPIDYLQGTAEHYTSRLQPGVDQVLRWPSRWTQEGEREERKREDRRRAWIARQRAAARGEK